MDGQPCPFPPYVPGPGPEIESEHKVDRTGRVNKQLARAYYPHPSQLSRLQAARLVAFQMSELSHWSPIPRFSVFNSFHRLSSAEAADGVERIAV